MGDHGARTRTNKWASPSAVSSAYRIDGARGGACALRCGVTTYDDDGRATTDGRLLG